MSIWEGGSVDEPRQADNTRDAGAGPNAKSASYLMLIKGKKTVIGTRCINWEE